MIAVKGDWVRIHKIILTSPERATQLPDDTKEVPLEMWDKGFLLNARAREGDEVEIESIIGRNLTGTLLEKNPQFHHSWGSCIPEILQIGRQVRGMLQEADNE
ncbi:MAG: 2-amino-4-ketopentanoate thiolase [Spirochaetaceae bacterium 4572_59]|nr:MAG: 2-amino-4-ketopentanoate thiolase [Spirochaetaceae bacterium 4572_59]